MSRSNVRRGAANRSLVLLVRAGWLGSRSRLEAAPVTDSLAPEAEARLDEVPRFAGRPRAVEVLTGGSPTST